MRIRTNMQMVGVTVLVCVFMIIWGKRSREQGETVQKKALEKIQAARDKGLAEAAEAATQVK